MKLKLWLLTAREGDALWTPWYDKARGFVCRAASEEEARRLAASSCGDEGEGAWLFRWHSRCVELTTQGGQGVIVRDFAAA